MVRLMFAPLVGIALALGMAGAVHAAEADPAVAVAQADRAFAAFPKDGPGVSVAVSQGGRTVYSRAFGAADIEHGDPATAQTPFHAASISKEFTALAIVMLAQEGKVDLNADIRRYLPYVPDFGATITVLDLLHHTSGLRDQWGLFTIAGIEGQSLRRQAQVVEMVRQQSALNFAPGTEFSYCNTGFTLLAEIVKAASGQTLRQYTTTHIFQPLGMTHTVFYDNARELVPGRATSYAPGRGGRPDLARMNFETVGATGLLTTADDLAIWGRELLHPKIISPALIAQMTTPGRLKDGTPIAYGLGLMLSDNVGHVSIGHGGSDAGFRAMFLTFPKEDTVVAVLASGQAPASDLADAVAAAFLDPGKPPAVSRGLSPSPSMLDGLVGLYINDWRGSMRLEARNGLLVRHSVEEPDAIAVFHPDGSFSFGQSTARFRATPGPDGRPLLAETTRWGGHPTLHRPAAAASPSASDLAALAGRYRSAELDVTYAFSVVDGRLTATSLRHPEPIVFMPSSTDRFDSTLGQLKVRRGPKGDVTGFLLDSGGGRILNLVFSRVSSRVSAGDA